jgi:riboflavin synthase
MFTGIIQAIGKITTVTPSGDDLTLQIEVGELDMSDVNTGDSIAVNGVCLTAVRFDLSHFEAHVSRETLNCTTGLGQPNSVNLEKAMQLSDRLGGHLVSGHVDGVGKVVRFESLGDCWQLLIQAPHALARYIAVKGSVAINGVSLTVNSISQDIFSINLIPHTLEKTSLQFLEQGSLVNIEVDLIARYVERMAEWEKESQPV